jgi:glutamyl-tRNA reductase
MNLALLGINFRSAPIELREKVSWNPDKIPATLQRIRARRPSAELVLVSTCNRTELYVADSDGAPQKDDLIADLLDGLDIPPIEQLASHFYFESGMEAAQHLVAVSSSLESMVVGETEILGQVKRAYMIAEQEELVGKTLRTVFPEAFRIAKRVHSETDISRGRVSVSSIAVEFADKVFESLSEKTVMIVGAGETAELALKSLVGKGVTEVLVLNRSFHKGIALASQCGGRAIQFDSLADYLARTDIVISSTGAPHCVIHTEAVRAAVKARRGRPILLIDIAVPRDIEASAGDLDNVYLYHIDDLQKVADGNLSKRQAAIDAAWAILKQGTTELTEAFEGADFRTLMQQFDRQAQAIKAAALERSFAKAKMAALPEACREEVDAVVQATINKLLAEPRNALRRAAKNGQWQAYSEVARDLFGFNKGRKK